MTTIDCAKEGKVVQEETLKEIDKFVKYLWEKSKEYYEKNKESLDAVPDSFIVPFEGLVNHIVQYCLLAKIPLESLLEAVNLVHDRAKQVMESNMKNEKEAN